MIGKIRNSKFEIRMESSRRGRRSGHTSPPFPISHLPFPISPRRSGFTLFEVVIALALLGILTGAVYTTTFSAMEASKSTLSEQASSRRLEAFLNVTRNAFLSLPREGRVHLRFTRASSGAPVPEVIFEEASGVFGVPSLGGGSLILSARPMSDGTRTMSVLRVPKDLQGTQLERYTSQGPWVPLLPRVERVKWTFLTNDQWREEWLPENGRPLAARLQMDCLDMPESKIDAKFWIPQLVAPAPPIASAPDSPNNPETGSTNGPPPSGSTSGPPLPQQ